MASINQNFLSQSGVNVAKALQVRAPVLNNPASRANVFGGARLRAPQIRPSYATALTDQVGPVVNGQQLASTLDVFARLALKKADDKNVLLAAEQLAQFEEQVRDLSYNPEHGYFFKEGKAAVMARFAVQEGIDKLISDRLEGVSPAVRQKMLPAIIGKRGTFLDNVAKYAVVQEKKWEDDTQKASVINLSKEAGYSAPNFPLTEHMVQTGLFNIFPDYPDGSVNPEHFVKRSKAYDEIALHRIKNIVNAHANGIKLAHQQANHMVSTTSATGGVPSLSSAGTFKILAYLDAETNKKLTQANAADARSERVRKRRISDVESSLVSHALKGEEVIPYSELADLLADGRITRSFAEHYEKKYIIGDTSVDAVVDNRQLVDDIYEAMYNTDTIHVQVNGEDLIDVLIRAQTELELKPETVAKIHEDWKGVGPESTRLGQIVVRQYNENKRKVEAQLADRVTSYMGTYLNADQERYVSTVMEEFRARLRNNAKKEDPEPVQRVVNSIILEFSRNEQMLKWIPTPTFRPPGMTYRRPRDLRDYERFEAHVVQLRENGIISADDFNRQMMILFSFQDALSNDIEDANDGTGPPVTSQSAKEQEVRDQNADWEEQMRKQEEADMKEAG